MSTLTIELTDKLAARLAAASGRQNMPALRIVEAALERALPADAIVESAEVGQNLAEKMKDLIGCFDSGMSDLSTNPKHLEGFGEWQR